jgi:hypothetical protein
MTVIRHWLAHRERWKDSPRVITPRDDDDAAEWRRLGYRVEGPFVPASELEGAVEACREAAFLIVALGHGGEHENCDPCEFVRTHFVGGSSR